MVLIGLMGVKCSGKTTGATYLIKTYGFVEKSFAEPLKRACQELFLLTDSQVFGTQEQKETPDPRWFDCSPRKMLQYVGTELLRDQLDKIMPGIGQNVFTHYFKLWYEDAISKNPNLCVVISDVRFQNEIDFIQNLGGKVIKINRSNVLSDDMHQSELELQKITSYDHLIENSSTIEHFYSEIDHIMVSEYNLKPQNSKMNYLVSSLKKMKFW
jgi:hypothetical protein